MSRSTPQYLRHILEEAQYLLAMAQGLSQSQFGQDETLKRAFVRSLGDYWRGNEAGPDRTTRAASAGGVASEGRHARPAHSRLFWSGL